jgi:hypothetical protein
MPVEKDNQCPDFYALAKVSPLPEADGNSVSPPSTKYILNVVGGVGGVGGTEIIVGTGVGGGASTMGGGVLGAVSGGIGVLSNESGKGHRSDRSVLSHSSAGFPICTGHGYVSPTYVAFGRDQQQQRQQQYVNLPPIHYGFSSSSFTSSRNHALSETTTSQLSSPTSQQITKYVRTLQYENENLLLRMRLLEQENLSRQLQVAQHQQQQQQQQQLHLQQLQQHQQQQQQQFHINGITGTETGSLSNRASDVMVMQVNEGKSNVDINSLQ